MGLQELTDFIKKKAGENSGINATLKFVLDEKDVIHLDGVSTPNVVSNDDKEAECTIKIATTDMEAIIGGTLNPMNAFMFGKIKVEGNMGVAMGLSKLFG